MCSGARTRAQTRARARLDRRFFFLALIYPRIRLRRGRTEFCFFSLKDALLAGRVSACICARALSISSGKLRGCGAKLRPNERKLRRRRALSLRAERDVDGRVRACARMGVWEPPFAEAEYYFELSCAVCFSFSRALCGFFF